jgi:hypothetical protein
MIPALAIVLSAVVCTIVPAGAFVRSTEVRPRARPPASVDWESRHCPTVRLRAIRHRPSSRLAPPTIRHTHFFPRRRRL